MASIQMKHSKSDYVPELSDTERMNRTIEYLYENPDEKAVIAACIYKVNVNSLHSDIHRTAKPTKQKGGQNKILTEVQIKAIERYVNDSYYAGCRASKEMVLSSIAHLRAAEIPSKQPPLQH